VIATSRGTISAAKLGTTIKAGAERPDSFVLTAGMLMAINDKQPSVQKNVSGLGGLTQPVLLLHHTNDSCAYTPARGATAFKPLLTGAKQVDIKMLSGGDKGTSDPCQAQSHHGFLGQDDEVVRSITEWLKGLPK
jgi:pimeloyl-ACP methyl ester carboxylesterase